MKKTRLCVTYSDGSLKFYDIFQTKEEAEWFIHNEGDHVKSWRYYETEKEE